MMTCPACGTPEQEGNFCGKCGKPLHKPDLTKGPVTPEQQVEQPIEQTQRATPPPVPPVQQAEPTQSPNATVEKLKKQGGNYWQYFLQTLKKPSQMGDERYFTFAIISTIISLILYALIPVVFTNKMLTSIYGFANSMSNGFFDGSASLGVGTFIRIFLYMGIFYVLLVALILLLSRQFGTMTSWKQGIAQIGAFNNIINVAFLVTLVLLLLNSLAFSMGLYMIIAMIFVTLVPLFTASFFFFKGSKMDPFISYLLTIIISLIFIVIYYAIFFEKIANDIQIQNFFDSFNF